MAETTVVQVCYFLKLSTASLCHCGSFYKIKRAIIMQRTIKEVENNKRKYSTILCDLLSLSDPLIKRITVSQTHRSQDSSSVVGPRWWAWGKIHKQVPHLNSNKPKWKQKHHYPEQHLNNLRYEILHVYSCFHNTQGRRLHGFCLQLSHFFMQSMKLLAHCFIFVLPFKLNNKKTHIPFRINTVLLKLFHVTAISKQEAESSQRTLNLDGFPPESFNQI